MMNKRSSLSGYLAVLGGSVLLAGCSTWSPDPVYRGYPITESFNLSNVEAGSGAGAGFQQALAKEYSAFASSLHQQGQWADADYFSRKGIAVEGGQRVLPEVDQNWLIPMEIPFATRTALRQGRAQLLAALDGGARERAPAIAARAQVKFDCWTEEVERNWQTGLDGTCHKEFLAAMAQLNPAPAAAQPPAAAAPAPAAAPRQYNVYFDFDRSQITPEAARILDQVIATVKANGGTRVVMKGKADLSGTDAYNLALSHRRADAVAAALRAKGVGAGQIQESWVGEREPPVPTPDGVREPRNRVVEINLQ